MVEQPVGQLSGPILQPPFAEFPATPPELIVSLPWGQIGPAGLAPNPHPLALLPGEKGVGSKTRGSTRRPGNKLGIESPAMPHAYTEDQLVEQPAMRLFSDLGWQVARADQELFGAHSP
jgi:hypothetical protein